MWSCPVRASPSGGDAEPPRDVPVWWRREVELPAAFVGQPLTLRLGAIDSLRRHLCRGRPGGWHLPRAVPAPALAARLRHPGQPHPARPPHHRRARVRGARPGWPAGSPVEHEAGAGCARAPRRPGHRRRTRHRPGRTLVVESRNRRPRPCRRARQRRCVRRSPSEPASGVSHVPVPGRAVGPHDRRSGAGRAGRCHLVPGRIEYPPGPPVPDAAARADGRLAPGVRTARACRS